MTVLLIAHGSPDSRHRDAIHSLAALTEESLGRPVHVGYLDHDSPSVPAAIDACAQHHDSTLTHVVGLLLSDGYHARVDVPSVLASTGPSIVNCGTLGLGDWLIPCLERSLDHVVAPAGTPGAVLVATGSSRPEARDDVFALATRWQQHRGAPVRAAFLTGDGPSVAEALSMLNDMGVTRRVLVPLLLAPGSMSDRVEALAVEHDVMAATPLLDPSRSPTEVISRIAEVCAAYGHPNPPQS